jgi:hypothetical protein
MRKLLFFLLLIMAVSCVPIEEGQKGPTYPYDVVVKDSCEYLRLRSGYAGYMAHKGNCKHCAEVRQREYDALVERIKEAMNRK